jgi:hypothetical protein
MHVHDIGGRAPDRPRRDPAPSKRIRKRWQTSHGADVNNIGRGYQVRGD